ncbi:putative extracellular alpha-1,3-glucanase/mutanase [Leptodontidium sp. 2 PMI_412]|nr:putative extracellular alpha-1,3-glucanase/mutanase [Leptodontidium sp. 2 PMI_412]
MAVRPAKNPVAILTSDRIKDQHSIYFPLFKIPAQVQARVAFAHFMVGNVKTGFTLADWPNEIVLAQQAHIDAFALNVAVGETGPLSDAFTAASSLGFKLFFSFDYAGNGLWDQGVVTSVINQYKANGAYYKRNGAPLVSTFEGPQVASQWTTIKQQTGCFFIPHWSSLGAKSAVVLGVADGLFSWAAWPYGAADMTNTVDASYLDFLGGKPYMMPVSPWFFTNMPGFAGKNWLWRGDDLWHDRWQQIFALMPEFIQIISWNNYGEGLAPFNYARGMPHDGWGVMLPFLIDTYKNGIASVTQGSVVAWYRLNSNTACASGCTTGNTFSQMQCELAPSAIAQDRIFYSVVLTSSASVTVTIGGTQQTGTWSDTPAGGVRIYHGSVPFNGATGSVVVTVAKTGLTLTMRGNAISATCANSVQNWNPWVGSAVGSVISPALDWVAKQVSAAFPATTATVHTPHAPAQLSVIRSKNQQLLGSSDIPLLL